MSGRLHHRLTGDDRDHALLLIHPLGADLSFWDECVREIDGRATTLAVDLPGVGGSAGRGRAVGLAEQAEALEALRGALKLGMVSAVGCAVSSMTAATYAARYPAHIAAMVLANPTPASAPQAREMLSARAQSVRQGGMDAVLPGAVDRAFHEKDARYARYMKRFAEQDPEAYAWALLAAAEADASEAFSKVACPTLLVPGRHDVLLPMERTEAAAALLPGAQITVMEDAAHFVPYQQPARFAALVLDFIGRTAAIA